MFPTKIRLAPASFDAAALVRARDNDNYYPSLFYANAHRPAYFALRALNYELASIDSDNALLGRIKFNYWRDSIKQTLAGTVLAHPLLAHFADLPQIKNQKLSPYHFTRLIATREAHYLNPSFTNLQDLAEYSAGTQASLLYLLLQLTQSDLPPTSSKASMVLPHSTPFEHTGYEHRDDGMPDELLAAPKEKLKVVDSLTLDHAASHLAVAITISILLRSIPHHAVKRINVIPIEIASRHSLTSEGLYRHGPEAEGLRESVATLVGIAHNELKTSRECFNGTQGIPDWAKPVFLSATPATSFLDRLGTDKFAYNVFDGGLQKRYWKLPFQIWGDYRKGFY